MGAEDGAVETRPTTWRVAPRTLLGAAWLCIVASGLLLATKSLGLQVLGYLLASVGGLSLVTLYHRVSRERLAAQGIAATRTQGAAAVLATVAAIALAVVYAYTIGWSVA